MSAAASAAVVVICPEWCHVARGVHLEELAGGGEGTVHHRSAPDTLATVSAVRRADGRPDDDDQQPAILLYVQDLATPEEAEQAAADLLAAASLLRSLL